MKDLGTLDGNNSEGAALNASGQVIGRASYGSSAFHAFLYSKGAMKDLGTLGGPGSHAVAINTAGDVTGTSEIVANDWRAFLYTGGQMLDLNDLVDPASPLKDVVTLSAGKAITDTGYILAIGTNSQTNTSHAYVLRKQVQCVPRGKRPC